MYYNFHTIQALFFQFVCFGKYGHDILCNFIFYTIFNTVLYIMMHIKLHDCTTGFFFNFKQTYLTEPCNIYMQL